MPFAQVVNALKRCTSPAGAESPHELPDQAHCASPDGLRVRAAFSWVVAPVQAQLHTFVNGTLNGIHEPM
jgi:hypothetical protein